MINEQIRQELNPFTEMIWNALSSNFYANIIATIELIVAILTIAIGGKKVLQLISEYKQKQREAVFGFYINLDYFIKRMKPLIFSDDGTPMKTLYVLSANEEINSMCGDTSFQEKLSNVALECLQYLSVKTNQIPPVDDFSEWNKWKRILDEFINYLNQFYLMGSDNHLPGLNSEEDLKNYCENVKMIFDQIDQKIEKETRKFFEDLKGEHDRYNENSSK